MLNLAHITFDCADAAVLAGFWSQILQRPVDDGANEYFATIDAAAHGPTYMFLKVHERKTAKNRCHLDLATDDREAQVQRLLGLGATYLAEHHEHGHHWVVLQDPSGNEFCIA